MSDEERNDRAETQIGRRQFITVTGSAVGASLLSSGLSGCKPAENELAEPSAKAPRGDVAKGPFNILFILTDQERHLRVRPPGFELPAHDRLQKSGVAFSNHQIASAVCSSSRSVIYTGRHIQHTRVYDNMDVPWVENMSPELPTLADMLAEAGYYCAYKGKWHLSKGFNTHEETDLPDSELAARMKEYGFSDYVGIGDVIGEQQGGYLNDGMIAEQGVRWLRVHGKQMQKERKPWFLALNFVNPHDVMFFNTDEPGQKVQDSGNLLTSIAGAPEVDLYAKQWGVGVPESRNDPFDATGRPPAHWEYQQARGVLVGTFPNENKRWARLLNYYMNCIRDCDQQIERVLKELDTLGLSENTIIVMTSDHGELAGAHGTHGKGATAYREQNNVPLIISHPAFSKSAGQTCLAVTSHLDLAPTLLSWTGLSNEQWAAKTRELKGKNITPLLASPAKAKLDAIRPGSLYNYNMLLYVDAAFLRKIADYLQEGNDPKKLKQAGIVPDLSKRGAIRSIFDGRYKFSRYFSPRQHNAPTTLEGLLKLNDLELFDTHEDLLESRNLAADARTHSELIMAMNTKMNALIAEEVGEDNGGFLPGGADGSWAATTFDP